MSNLLLQLLKFIMVSLCETLSPENVKKIIDKAFDKLEKAVKDSSTQWDDALVLPMIKALRKALDVPDEEDEE